MLYWFLQFLARRIQKLVYLGKYIENPKIHLQYFSFCSNFKTIESHELKNLNLLISSTLQTDFFYEEYNNGSKKRIFILIFHQMFELINGFLIWSKNIQINFSSYSYIMSPIKHFEIGSLLNYIQILSSYNWKALKWEQKQIKMQWILIFSMYFQRYAKFSVYVVNICVKPYKKRYSLTIKCHTCTNTWLPFLASKIISK